MLYFFLKKNLLPEDLFTLCCISSVPSLFAKVIFKGFLEYKGLNLIGSSYISKSGI